MLNSIDRNAYLNCNKLLNKMTVEDRYTYSAGNTRPSDTEQIQFFANYDKNADTLISEKETTKSTSGRKKKTLKNIGLSLLGAGIAIGIGILLYNKCINYGNTANPTLFENIKKYLKNYPERLKYTTEHKKAFLQVEKELCGKNSINGYLHDSDKLIMYIMGFPQKLVQKIHHVTAPHHIRSGKVRNAVMTVIDWECAHLTKPDKPLRAREFYEKCGQKIPEIEAALKKLGL